MCCLVNPLQWYVYTAGTEKQSHQSPDKAANQTVAQCLLAMAASDMVAIVLLFLAGLTTEAWSQRERATLPLTLQPTSLKGGCPSREVIAEIQEEVQGKLQETVEPARRELREQIEGDTSGGT